MLVLLLSILWITAPACASRRHLIAAVRSLSLYDQLNPLQPLVHTRDQSLADADRPIRDSVISSRIKEKEERKRQTGAAGPSVSRVSGGGESGDRSRGTGPQNSSPSSPSCLTVGYVNEPAKKKKVKKWTRKTADKSNGSEQNNLLSAGPQPVVQPGPGPVPPSPCPPPPGLLSPGLGNGQQPPHMTGGGPGGGHPAAGHHMGPPLPHLTPGPGVMPGHHMHPGPPPGPPHPHPSLHPGPPHHMHPHNHMSPHHVPHMPHGMPPHMSPDGRPPPHLMDHHHHHHPGRHTPYPHMGSPDYRIHEINKRLQQRTEESDNLWWDSFANEFFEDDATLTLTFGLEDGPKRYTIGRTLIPRYFRSIFDGGVTDLSFHLKHPKESFHNTTQHITLDCEMCSMITSHGKAPFSKMNQFDGMKDQMIHKDDSIIVCTMGRLVVEFTFDDLMRIRSWHFATRHHQELIPRSIVALQAQQDPGLLEQMSKNITRMGLTTSTLNYLRLCVILEPMQELMSRHKAYSLSPRDCLKTTLFQKWQRMIAPPETQRPASKRRKRKSSATNSGPMTGSGGAGKKKNANNNSMSPGPNFSLASQDVMVVGEPSLMGGEFGDEDERLITRLENNQYDPTSAGPSNGIDEGEEFVSLGGGGPPVSSAMTAGSWNVGPASGGAGGGPLPPLTQQPQCTPGSGPPSADNRQGSTPNGSSASMEDKKPSPNSLNQ